MARAARWCLLRRKASNPQPSPANAHGATAARRAPSQRTTDNRRSHARKSFDNRFSIPAHNVARPCSRHPTGPVPPPPPAFSRRPARENRVPPCSRSVAIFFQVGFAKNFWGKFSSAACAVGAVQWPPAYSRLRSGAEIGATRGEAVTYCKAMPRPLHPERKPRNSKWPISKTGAVPMWDTVFNFLGQTGWSRRSTR
jgi:hypothetical protein